MEVIFASQNPNKIKEVKAILASLPVNIVSLHDLNFDEELEETGSTFQENAFLKAKFIYERYQRPVFADDSGLIIPALGGQPGVHSARYSGLHGDYQSNNSLVLEKMKDVTDRRAYFLTVICYFDSKGMVHYFQGRLDGAIAMAPSGTNGFGYDPLFYLPALDKTLGQTPETKKNELSHRYRALREFTDFLKKEVI
ncbi:MAG: RdgB/HAM1 family non-canonical purine NTP pyrophosphatase [Acholeplasmataceae bacterium]|nr:RdgB/HAM1 family non-canonical purine NTP pyrophosphatase [Acholeplasmataceae bacterium]